MPLPVSQADERKSIQRPPNLVELKLTKQHRQLILSEHLWWPVLKPAAKKVDLLFIGKSLRDVQARFSDKIEDVKKSQTSYAILIRDGKRQASSNVFIQRADVDVGRCQKVFSTEIDLPEIYWLQLGGKEIFDQRGETVAPQFDARPWPQPCNVWTGEPHSVTEHLEQLIFLKEAQSKRAGLTCIVGVSNWKYRCLHPFFKGPSSKIISCLLYTSPSPRDS